MRALVFLVLLALTISACANESPTIDPSSVQTAIAQTEAADPTSTSTKIPTETPTKTSTPTETATPTPTNTPTETTSPTPDLRVIDADPYTFLLKAEDLPEDAYYYLPNSEWISPHRNYEVISGWGVDEGRAYMAATGRVDGWWVYYLRDTNAVMAPEQIGDNPVLFRTIEGAQLLITQYGTCVYKDKNPNFNFVPVQTDLKIGDLTNVCISREMQSSGENHVHLIIEFSYRNVTHNISGWGWEDEVQLDYLANVARTLLAKLEAMPLSDSVTFEP
jgi:hypothetical protein